MDKVVKTQLSNVYLRSSLEFVIIYITRVFKPKVFNFPHSDLCRDVSGTLYNSKKIIWLKADRIIIKGKRHRDGLGLGNGRWWALKWNEIMKICNTRNVTEEKKKSKSIAEQQWKAIYIDCKCPDNEASTSHLVVEDFF